eukprot:GHVR01129134.1.p2 GENE.GHVR01129134.1~~GHVR01129134.1.p2  ORF type:complete len:100 (-),score=8.76 GHVR01129134.1:1108-1407(-)
MPDTWVPNIITLVGFIFNVVGNISIAFQFPLKEPVVPWTLLFFGTCVLIYQTLDNMDGKQARRTGNSSPLGMIFDHGCDAMGVVFLALGVGRLICLDDK